MTSTRPFKRCSFAIVVLSFALPHLAFTVTASPDSRPGIDSKPTPAIDNSVGVDPEKNVAGIAAVIDEHVIPLNEVILACLRQDRSYVVDQMIQGYVIDRECQRRGIVVSESEIDRQVAGLRKNLAPVTVEETLQANHVTMPELRAMFRQDLERETLVAAQVKPVKLIHCREIFVAFGPDATSGKTRTEAEALALAKELREQIKPG